MILALAPGGDIATLVRDAAADGAESIVVVIAPGADPLAAALSRAAVGPLAVEHAPGVRINAVAPGATTALPEGVHFTLIEAVADHICETLFLQDARVQRVVVKIVKLAIAEAGEAIGITLVRHRR